MRSKNVLQIVGGLVYHDGRSTVRGEDGVDVHHEPRNEARIFGAAPPGPATCRAEHVAQEWPSRRFESSLRKDTALRSVPNVERRPGVFSQHLLQPKQSIPRLATGQAPLNRIRRPNG